MNDFHAIIAALEAKRDALTAAIDGLRALDGDVAPATSLRRKHARRKTNERTNERTSKTRAVRSLPDEAGILDHLKQHGEPMTPRELAKRLKITRQTLTKQIAPLIASGAVLATGATMNRQFRLPPRSKAAKEAP
jgi:predicted HTH transcriptional regulator